MLSPIIEESKTLAKIEEKPWKATIYTTKF
jgi:hypothetical protein